MSTNQEANDQRDHSTLIRRRGERKRTSSYKNLDQSAYTNANGTQGFLLLPHDNKKQFRGSSKEVQDTCRSRNNGSNPLPLIFSAIIPELTGCMSVSMDIIYLPLQIIIVKETNYDYWIYCWSGCLYRTF